MERLITLAVVVGIALIVLVVGRFIAKRLPEQVGELVGQLIPVLVIAIVVVGLLIIIDPDQADQLLDSTISSIPKVMVAVIVVIIARALGRILGLFVETALRRIVPTMASRARVILASAVLGVGIIIALQQIGISTDIILILVAALAFGTALALALAVGLGAVPIARQVAAGRHVQNTFADGDRVRVGVHDGTISGIGLASTRVVTSNGDVEIPNEEFLSGAVSIQRSGD